MKIFTRVLAVVMIVAVMAALMAACGEDSKKKGSSKAAATEEDKGIVNNMVVGTWVNESPEDSYTWEFKNDKTFTFTEGDKTRTGTYLIHSADNGKIDITFSDTNKAEKWTYTCTEKVLQLSTIFDVSTSAKLYRMVKPQ